MSRFKFWGFVILTLAFAGTSSRAAAPEKRTTVLAELFTSEGCSDCPPADQLLMQMAERGPVEGVEVIAMSEHVDYWNQQGWSDPFSSAQFSSRQNDYATAFGNRDIYTPQMIIDGQIEFIGSNRVQAVKAITTAAQKLKPFVEFAQAGGGKDALKFQVSFDLPKGLTARDSADVFLAITENNLSSSVNGGENRGRKLTHVAVVRKLIAIGKVSEGNSFTAAPVVRLERQWKTKDLHAVAFVQGRTDRHVLAVSSIPVKVPAL